MAIVSFEDYKNNLKLLGDNNLISIVDDDKLGIDDRYFNYFRTSYNIDDIINIIDKSFRAVILNLDLKVRQGSTEITKEESFIRESIEKFHYFALNNFVDEKGKEKIVNLICDYTILLKNIIKELESNNEETEPLIDSANLEEAPCNYTPNTSRGKRLFYECLSKVKCLSRFCIRKIRQVWSYCVNSFTNRNIHG